MTFAAAEHYAPSMRGEKHEVNTDFVVGRILQTAIAAAPDAQRLVLGQNFVAPRLPSAMQVPLYILTSVTKQRVCLQLSGGKVLQLKAACTHCLDHTTAGSDSENVRI